MRVQNNLNLYQNSTQKNFGIRITGDFVSAGDVEIIEKAVGGKFINHMAEGSNFFGLDTFLYWYRALKDKVSSIPDCYDYYFTPENLFKVKEQMLENLHTLLGNKLDKTGKPKFGWKKIKQDKLMELEHTVNTMMTNNLSLTKEAFQGNDAYLAVLREETSKDETHLNNLLREALGNEILEEKELETIRGQVLDNLTEIIEKDDEAINQSEVQNMAKDFRTQLQKKLGITAK